jgi:hypothetical protein
MWTLPTSSEHSFSSLYRPRGCIGISGLFWALSPLSLCSHRVAAMARLRPFKPHVLGWSQRLRMLGQVECNWMVKSVQLRIQYLASRLWFRSQARTPSASARRSQPWRCSSEEGRTGANSARRRVLMPLKPRMVRVICRCPGAP